MEKARKVIVIGAGAAGLIAAAIAAESGAQVTLLEKKEKLGQKLAITGKGRCNVTSSLEGEQFMMGYPHNSKFLYSAFNEFSNQDLIKLLNKLGVKTKTERGARVFPVSESADEIVKALSDNAIAKGVKILTKSTVKKILINKDKAMVTGIKLVDQDIKADAIIIATGGLSYPGTGSTGDGYNFAKLAGHHIVDTRPGLVPLMSEETWVKELQGLSLKNVRVRSFQEDGKKINEDFGEMLFTHFGLSGPIILSMSRDIGDYIYRQKKKAVIKIDLKPALSEDVLEERIKRDLEKYSRKIFKNALNELLPRALIPVIIELSQIEAEKVSDQLSKKEIKQLVALIKNLNITISGTRPVAEAIVTAGGIDVKEINPRTMQSKLIKGLYFAGEVIDIDAYTGGFNLQAAFSTGYVAGKNAGSFK